MLRILCATSRNVGIFCNNYPKKAFITNIRGKSNVYNIARAKNSKQQPVEVIKWVLLVIPVSSFGLGCWQVYRLKWKLELIDRLQAISNSAAVDIPRDFTELEALEYKPVKVRGKFIHDKEILIGPRALIEHDSIARFGSLVSDPKKNQGWLVVTPFQLKETGQGWASFGSLVSDPKKNQGWLVVTPFQLKETGQVILVNRGWIPQSMRSKELRAGSMVKDEVELTGIVRLTEKRAPFMPKNNPEKGSWFFRDLEEMASHIGCSPVWLDARGIPDPPQGWPLSNQTRVTLRNEHFSYVVTWYCLSAFTAVMWHRYFIRKLPLL